MPAPMIDAITFWACCFSAIRRSFALLRLLESRLLLLPLLLMMIPNHMHNPSPTSRLLTPILLQTLHCTSLYIYDVQLNCNGFQCAVYQMHVWHLFANEWCHLMFLLWQFAIEAKFQPAMRKGYTSTRHMSGHNRCSYMMLCILLLLYTYRYFTNTR